MATIINVKNPSNNKLTSEIEHHHLLRPPSTTFKPLPQNIIQSIENDRTDRLSYRRSTINQLSFDIPDDSDDNYATIPASRKRSAYAGRIQRSPSDIRITVSDDPNEQLETNQIQMPIFKYENEKRNSVPSIIAMKSPKQNRVDNLRRTLLEHRFGRRIHSSVSSSSSTLRPVNRRRSTPNYRRQVIYLPRNSKWYFVRNHLHDIAMMNETYARMKLIEQDLRWIHLREQISKRVLDMREMSMLRQQVDGKLKKSLKTIPIDEVVHVERDGRVYSIGTRDLVLGRLIGDEDIELDTFAQLDARRKFQVKQSLLRQQEGRTRLKKYIAFSFCLCNLSFIVLMFAAMFIFAMKTIIELKLRELV
jgi:hypothetical protein